MAELANVVPLRPEAEDTATRALDAFRRHLDRCSLVEHTKRAYRRQAAVYLRWLAANTGRHPDAFHDEVGAEAAMTGWRRDLINGGGSPASVIQGLAAVALLYEAGTSIRPRKDKVKRPRVQRPGAPDALDANQEAALRRAADRRSPRDAAIIHFLLDTGARVEECARLDVTDIPMTARTGTVRLVGKGNEVRRNPLPPGTRERLSKWLDERSKGMDPDNRRSGPLWLGQRGPMTIEGITKVVLAVGAAAGIEKLRPHRLRHTFATRLRREGVDIAVIQRLMGHASIETTQRYFRASDAEIAEAVARVFGA